jgi:hypothetical protein
MRIGATTFDHPEVRRKMRQEQAEAIAISALSFIASDPERLDRFLAVTGLDPAALRAAAGAPGFLSGVLDYLCSDEPLLLAHAAEQDMRPETVAAAQRALGGPPAEDW